jgi:ribonuclease BN (tRNA processing enzyme)
VLHGGLSSDSTATELAPSVPVMNASKLLIHESYFLPAPMYLQALLHSTVEQADGSGVQLNTIV